MPLTDADRLRGMLSERIPDGGQDTDTLFSDSEVEDYLLRGVTLEAAAYLGWRDKAAEYTNLANVNEGNSARNFSDMAKNALQMVKKYEPFVSLGTPARARSRRITRTGGSIT